MRRFHTAAEYNDSNKNSRYFAKLARAEETIMSKCFHCNFLTHRMSISPQCQTLFHYWILPNCCCTFHKQPDNSCGFSSKLRISFFCCCCWLNVDRRFSGRFSAVWIWIVLLSFFFASSLPPPLSVRRYEVVVYVATTQTLPKKMKTSSSCCSFWR